MELSTIFSEIKKKMTMLFMLPHFSNIPIETQHLCFETDIVLPCYYIDENKEKKIGYFPGISGSHMKYIYEDLGNPLVFEFQNTSKQLLCVITPPLPIKTTYSIYNLPFSFPEKVNNTTEYTLASLQELYPHKKYEVVGSKLNILNSERMNIALFIHYEDSIQVDKQFYYTPHNVFNKYDPCETNGIQKIRIIPEPIMTKFGESGKAVKLIFEFVNNNENKLFEKFYDKMQHFVKNEMFGFKLRSIRMREIKTMVVIAQCISNHTIINMSSILEKQHKFCQHIDLIKNYVSIPIEIPV